MSQSSEIFQPKVLLVEGKDEISFFKEFLHFLNIRDLLPVKTSGKDNFKNEFPALLKNQNFKQNVRTIAIIQDSDKQDPSDTFQSICHILKENKLTPPLTLETFSNSPPYKIGIFIIPNNQKKGMLESLCLESVQSDSRMDCVDKYFQCLNSKLTPSDLPKNQFKASLRAFLSGFPEDIPSLGIASKKNIWDFSHTVFKPLSEFLKNI